jgi:hypothetical protein
VARLGRKVLLLVVVLAVLAASLPGVAGAAAKKESTKGKDASPSGVVGAGPGSAKGKGTASGAKFKFSAKSTKGANTANPTAKGKYSLTNGTEFVKGEVQCLEVTSVGGANFAGAVKKSNIIPKGGSGEFEALDSGQPKGQGDLFSVNNFTPDAPTCSAPIGSGSPITSGNITVHAA